MIKLAPIILLLIVCYFIIGPLIIGVNFGKYGQLLILITSIGYFLWCCSRYYLVFPSIAVSQPITLQKSWQLTKYRQAKLFFVIILYPILIGLPFQWLAYKFSLTFLDSIVWPLLLIMEITVLSLTYIEIIPLDGNNISHAQS